MRKYFPRGEFRSAILLVSDLLKRLGINHYFFLIVIQFQSRVVILHMLNDNKCKRIVKFMVAVIITFATTGLTIINSVN
jgi:hypothetical protein